MQRREKTRIVGDRAVGGEEGVLTHAEKGVNPEERVAVEGAISVWSFCDAPRKYQVLSDHGGDEDWVAFVPDRVKLMWIGWMQEGTAFGCCRVSEHTVEGGVVRIGAHA